MRFNSLGKFEQNLCRFAAADAVGEAELFKIAVSDNDQKNLRTIAEIGAGAFHHAIDAATFFQASEVFGFEPASDMFSNGVNNVNASGLSNLHPFPIAIEDIPEKFNEMFDLTISIMILHFCVSYKSYFSDLSRISKKGSLHILVDAMMPTDLSPAEELAFSEFFSKNFSFRTEPLDVISFENFVNSQGFEILHYSNDKNRVDTETASLKTNMFPKDQYEIIQEITNRYGLEICFFYTFKFLKTFVLRKL